MLTTMQDERLLYAPEAYSAADPWAIVRRYPFALLITCGPSGMLATSIPILPEADGARDRMIGHMARANPQACAMVVGQSALAIFCGPHAYISASWYRERLTVPTWNYVSAHVRGTLEPIDDPAQQLAILRRTAAVVEGANDSSWTLEDAPPGRVDTLLPRIRSFRLTVGRIEGVTKLSQTHPASDRRRVIQRLLARGGEGDVEIAQLMAGLSIENDCP
ncbi:MAG: FMN-binding negative transcriptional regulator [Acidobacteria bacterium]|nr:MAG: FMN-binding negative transcriptional regulator [Acidobacteriota bacterium]